MIDHSRIPNAQQFYTEEIGKLSRPSRRWAMGRCPFHESKSGRSFSVNIDSGGFHCFGCDTKGGDVIAFTRLRYNLGFKEACQRVGCWDAASSPETARKFEAQIRERNQQRQAEELQKAEEREQRLQLRDDLHTAIQLEREVSARLDELAGVESAEVEDCWQLLSLLNDRIRECEQQFCAAAGLEPLL
jgi:CHC2 zinc finger